MWAISIFIVFDSSPFETHFFPASQSSRFFFFHPQGSEKFDKVVVWKYSKFQRWGWSETKFDSCFWEKRLSDPDQVLGCLVAWKLKENGPCGRSRQFILVSADGPSIYVCFGPQLNWTLRLIVVWKKYRLAYFLLSNVMTSICKLPFESLQSQLFIVRLLQRNSWKICMGCVTMSWDFNLVPSLFEFEFPKGAFSLAQGKVSPPCV